MKETKKYPFLFFGAADDILTLSGMSQTSDKTNRGDLTPNSGQVPEGEYIRKFDIGVREASRLVVDQSKFLHLMSKIKTLSTGDPEFKSFEEREKWHRRYFTLMGHSNTQSLGNFTSGALTKAQFLAYIDAGSITGLQVGTDFDTYGQFSIYGRTSRLGASETAPYFIVPNMTIKLPICLMDNSNSDKIVDNGYLYLIVDSVSDVAAQKGKQKSIDCSIIGCDWSRDYINSLETADKFYFGHGDVGSTVAEQATTTSRLMSGGRAITSLPTAGQWLRFEDRITITGNTHAEGSGLPGNKYEFKRKSTFGYTQIWKQDLGMTNTGRATQLQNNINLWQQHFGDAILQHKQDINQSLYWGMQSKTYDSKQRARRTTGGMIPYILANSYVFSMSANKSLDDFTDDLFYYYHPENGMAQDTLFFASSQFMNWLNSLTSGFINNVFDTSNSSPFRFPVQVENRRQLFGIDIISIRTPRGVINVTEDSNLDGSGIHLMSVGLQKVAWRPLSGNGVNRDTSIYTGVQSVENTGIDAKVDLIQTEGGFDFWYPECHAIWKAKI